MIIAYDFDIQNLRVENGKLRNDLDRHIKESKAKIESTLEKEPVHPKETVFAKEPIFPKDDSKLVSSTQNWNKASIQQKAPTMISVPVIAKQESAKFDLGAGPTISQSVKCKLRKYL